MLPPVVAVAPSGATVPQRLLRLSLQFAAPVMAPVLPALALRRADGSVIAGALLQQELWSPDRRVLTVLLDPGRVKTGLIAHDTYGWALPAGSTVALSLGGTVLHRWSVRAGGCVPPDPARWAISAPPAGTMAPIVVRLRGAIDAQSRDLIALADARGHRVAGAASLLAGETRWLFTPAAPWRRGTLRLIVHPRLEDSCGDAIGEAFERRAGAPPAAVPLSRTIEIRHGTALNTLRKQGGLQPSRRRGRCRLVSRVIVSVSRAG